MILCQTTLQYLEIVHFDFHTYGICMCYDQGGLIKVYLILVSSVICDYLSVLMKNTVLLSSEITLTYWLGISSEIYFLK